MKRCSRSARAGLIVAILMTAYVTAFGVVHSSRAMFTLRHPAANLQYWYYSNNETIESLEFYGFWPLRQWGYRLSPEFSTYRHNGERRYPTWSDAD